MFEGLAYSGLGYKIIDADAHLSEAPDTWSKRLPRHLVDRGPQFVRRDDGGDAWVFDGGKLVSPLHRLEASAGLDVTEIRKGPITYDEVRPGVHDPVARLADMDVDGIHAQVLFPSPFSTDGLLIYEDRELQVACTRAYNDWLIDEFCATAPDRYVGIGMMPITGVDDAIAEAEDALKKGHKGLLLHRWPNGSQWAQPEDDRFWAFAQDAGAPVLVHIGMGFTSAKTSEDRVAGLQSQGLGALTKSGGHTLPAFDALMGQAIAERFPRIKIVLVECGIGWIPCYLEQADDRWMRYRFYRESDCKMSPSEQFRQSYYVTFMNDRVGVTLRHWLGVDRVMWSTDYPHGQCDWPLSRFQIDRLFHDVPADEKRMMLHDNAVNLFGLTGV